MMQQGVTPDLSWDLNKARGKPGEEKTTMSQSTAIARPAAGSPIAGWAEDPKGVLQLTGAEPPLTREEQDVQERVHRFAAEVMRPIGQQLDRMTPEEVIAENSPLWSVFKAFGQLGLGVDRLLEFEPEQMARMLCLVFEELGWGDAGLAISLGASMLPRLTAAKFGNQFLLEHTPESMIGCWGATEPEHGSDVLDANKQIFNPQGNYGRPDCVAKLYDDKVVINGRKSDWISNGTIAQVCILYCVADTGEGPDPGQGCTVIVPLDARGVSRGKPLDKMGQRALNQGAVIFDEFELALAYAHERKQGGVPIIRHQSVAYRLFHMYRKVEAARALSRRALIYNYTQPEPAIHVAMASKITGTQTSFEVASEALQIFCGKGLIPEYPIEKIFRDTRASLIEDGCNEILAIKGGNYLINPELL